MASSSAATSASPRATVGGRELPALIDGVRLGPKGLTVDATDPGFLRGDGVFEVVRLYNGIALEMNEHLARLARSADALELEYDATQLELECAALCAESEPIDGYVRVVVTRAGTRLVMAEPQIAFPPAMRLLPIEHAVSPIVAGVKSLSYAANCHAKRIAESRGWDDALLVDAQDRVLELPFASFGAVFDGRLTLPPLELGILASITRAILVDEVDADVREIAVTELGNASEACVIGTGMEVCPVSEIAGVANFEATGPVVDAASRALGRSIRMRLQSEDRFRSATTARGGH